MMKRIGKLFGKQTAATLMAIIFIVIGGRGSRMQIVENQGRRVIPGIESTKILICFNSLGRVYYG